MVKAAAMAAFHFSTLFFARMFCKIDPQYPFDEIMINIYILCVFLSIWFVLLMRWKDGGPIYCVSQKN